MEGPIRDRDGTAVIIVRRLTDQPFAVNPDLIERVECTPDTILVLVDGTRYIVRESLAEIVDLVREFRTSVVAGALNPPVHLPEVERDPESVVVQLPTSQKGV